MKSIQYKALEISRGFRVGSLAWFNHSLISRADFPFLINFRLETGVFRGHGNSIVLTWSVNLFHFKLIKNLLSGKKKGKQTTLVKHHCSIKNLREEQMITNYSPPKNKSVSLNKEHLKKG